MKRLNKIYYFLKMRKIIKNIIRKYNIYIQNKVNKYIFYRLIKSFNIFFYIWKLIALNFIIKFFFFINLIIKMKCDAIIIITNKFIKYTYFILQKIIITTKNITYKILKIIIANYNMLDEIILNKDKIFIFKI